MGGVSGRATRLRRCQHLSGTTAGPGGTSSSDRPADERFAEAPQARIRGPTFYNRKAKYDRTDVSDAISPKALDDENAKLNKLLADPILDARL